MSKAVQSLEDDIDDIKTSISSLKKKDEEILNILLRTKMLLDRQKIEDMKLKVLEDEEAEEEETEYLANRIEERVEEIADLQETIRTEFMDIISRTTNGEVSSNV